MKLIPLTGKYGLDKFAMVDDEDYERVMQHKWHLSTHGYAVSSIVIGYYDFHGQMRNVYKLTFLHHFVLNILPNAVIKIDHEDRNKLNCQKYNLRPATHRQNGVNVGKNTNIITSSKYKGVGYKTTRSHTETPYKATIQVNNKKIHLGFWESEERAAYVYDIYCIKFNGEFGWTNFPRKNYEGLDIDEEIRKIELTKIEQLLKTKIKNRTSRYWNVYHMKRGKNSKKVWFAFLFFGMRTNRFASCETEYEAALKADKKAFEMYGKNYHHFNFLKENFTIEMIENEISKIEATQKPKRNTVGISWIEKRQKWLVRLKVNNKRATFGTYRELEEAMKIHDLYAIKFFNKPTHTNFPLENYKGLNIDKEIEKIIHQG